MNFEWEYNKLTAKYTDIDVSIILKNQLVALTQRTVID